MNIDNLKAGGIDYDDGLERFSNKVNIYEKYLKKLTEITLFSELRAAYEKNDLKEAFACAHKLKAYVGNLSIPVLFDEICELTEILRAGSSEGVEEMLTDIEKKYADVCACINKEL